MAQSTGQNLKVDEARLAENVAAVKPICPSYQESGFEVEAMIEEIRGFLRRYAAAGSLDLRQTRQLGRLHQDLKDQFCRLENTWETMRGDVTDGNDFDELEEWVANTEEEVKNTLLDSEVFMEVRETMLSPEHLAGEDLATGPAGSDVVLQVTEATTNTLTGLDKILETCETLTQVVGDAEEQAEPSVQCA
jgi:hypothetical protein